MSRLPIVILFATLLAACTKEAPKPSDPAALAHAKPAPAAAPAPPPAAPAPAANAPSPDAPDTVETEGICKDLDQAVTADQLECLGRKYTYADTLLNEEYKRVMAALAPERRAALKTSQRAWIKERDAACEEAGKEAEGGTLQPVIMSSCAVRMTEERVAFLARFR